MSEFSDLFSEDNLMLYSTPDEILKLVPMPDIIFMDIQLPGMDGYSAARNIRRLPREEAMTVPILAMTANAFSQDVEKAFDSGMNAHMAKPIDVDELFQKLYHFLYS